MKIKTKTNTTTKTTTAAAADPLTSDLQAQHNYVEGLRQSGEKGFQLVAAAAFVEGMRDSGYKSTGTALDELIDNSIQAQATRVDVLYSVATPEGNQHELGDIAVVDNGHGMEPEMIRAAVLWGGTHRQGDRSGFGRFGFGLPSAAVSIARHFEVYSKIKGADWHRVSVDLDQICAGKLTNNDGLVIAPRAERTEPPAWVTKELGKRTPDQGTVILLVAPDRLTSGFRKPNGFHKNLMEHLGLIYRGVLTRCALFLNGQRIERVDPLFLDPNARYYDVGNKIRAEGREKMQFTMKGRDGREGAVRLRFSYMPPGFQNGPEADENPRFPIMKANNAYLVVTRAGRQIDLVERPRYQNEKHNITLINYDRNWAVELDFDPELDEEFGITVTKQQVTLSDRVWQVLEENGLPAIIKNDLRARGKADRGDRSSEDAKSEDKTSEQVEAEAERFEKKRAPISDEKKEQARKKLEEQAEKEAAETQKPKEEVQKEILQKAEDKKFTIEFEPLEGAPFYRPELFGPQTRIWINTRHRFYSDVYEALKASPRVRSAIELLLFAIGAEELTSEDDRELFYKTERKNWSDRLALRLQLLERRSSLEDEQSAATEIKETA